jgi:hypothetical protein
MKSGHFYWQPFGFSLLERSFQPVGGVALGILG